MNGRFRLDIARALGLLFVLVPMLVLATAYAAMSVQHGTALLWNVPVHEDGHRTLAQTLFYFEHATRELPIDLLFGIAVGAGGAMALAAPRHERRGSRPWLIAAMLAACVLVMTGATALQLGPDALRDNLLQYPTREGAPLTWGAHWRYHLLERGPMILLALSLWGVLRSFRNDPPEPRAARGALAVVATYIAPTVLFTPDWAALRLPFTDARYLGHEAREIFTHGLITLPLSLGVILLRCPQRVVWAAWPARVPIGALALVALSLSCFVFVLLAALGAGSASAGQSDSMVTLLAPHFFEHGFTYLVAPLTAVLVYERLR
ncbi:MAG: hypothetical protein ABIM50_13645 [Novosphingobium sp.]